MNVVSPRTLAVPTILAIAVIASPALAGSGALGTSAKSKCAATRGKHRVRVCTGQRGPRGATGRQGPRGKIGFSGPAGRRGRTGARGLPGPQGPAGPQGSSVGVRAQAIVDPGAVATSSSPAGLLSAQGFTGVRRIAAGTYCLATGLAPAVAVVGGDAGHSAAGVIPVAAFNSRQAPCTSGELQVQTFDAAVAPAAKTNSAGFSIVVA